MQLPVQNLPIVSDDLSRYIYEINKFPLLSEGEEREYANRLMKDKDIEAAHRLVTSNLRFVVKIAGEYKHYGLRMLDLIQEGNVGLMLAVRKFNPGKGVRLISYAVWWIRAQIHNFIMGSWSLVKIGTTQAQKKLFFKLRQTQEAIDRLDCEGALETVAAEVGVKASDVNEMNLRMQGEVALDAEIIEGTGKTIAGALCDTRPDQEALLIQREREKGLSCAVGRALDGLTDRERFVVEKRIMADDPITLQDIADTYSITRERARQIEANVMKKVKAALMPYRDLVAA